MEKCNEPFSLNSQLRERRQSSGPDKSSEENPFNNQCNWGGPGYWCTSMSAASKCGVSINNIFLL